MVRESQGKRFKHSVLMLTQALSYKSILISKGKPLLMAEPLMHKYLVVILVGS